MKTVHLHGSLKKFGDRFSLDVMYPREAVHALCTQIDGFAEELKDGEYRVSIGTIEIDEQQLGLAFGKIKEMHIVPVPAGSKKKGVGKIILGAALFAAGAWGAWGATNAASIGAGASEALGSSGFLSSITFGDVMLYGANMALTGIASMLTSTPAAGNYAEREAPDQRASFIFNGPVNMSEQGQPIPLVYGRVRTGSVVVSSGIQAEQI